MTFSGSYSSRSPLGDLPNNIAMARRKNYFTGSLLVQNAGESTTVVQGQLRPIYRGILAGSYVYSIGSPPGGGATFITIIGYTE